MYTLANADLKVSILDPRADVSRLGSRYCTGGYIWQVTDRNLGELFSGPQYPQEPNTFDGQGAPEMFYRALGVENAPLGGEVGCIGVGRVRRTSPLEPFDVRHNREVIEFLNWDVISNEAFVIMTAVHTFREWSYSLIRTVSLFDRTIKSETKLKNTGGSSLPVRWFAHPFFPITNDNVMCRFSPAVRLQDSPGYELNSDGFITRKSTHPWARGCYLGITPDAKDRPLSVMQRHSRFGVVTAETDFAPAFLPVWGNDRTFSFEPYFERTLLPGNEAQWSISYRCGTGGDQFNSVAKN